ncbi:solute carrier family 28 member 3 [Biomphalaria pfeifferi]|uniref:Sodium/nucleoside cotransporter n=1 Tax=Biomphalaria pfeifferi TaxID=112525 RepID=A0AAD8BP65_BIOPF|nr:solute carrier family 28 member 3 [Biomphalaria pfeifferi]
MAELKTINTWHGQEDSIPLETGVNGQIPAYDNKAFTDYPHVETFVVNGKHATKSLDNELDANPVDDEPSRFSIVVGRVQKAIFDFKQKNKEVLNTIFKLVLLLAYFAYFAYAMYYRFGDEGSWRLLIVTILASLGILLNLFLSYRRRKHEADEDSGQCTAKLWKLIAKIRLNIVLPIVLTIGFIVYIIVDVGLNKPRNLISLAGIAFFVVSFFLFSHNPSKVKWRPVYWGIALQIIFAMLILKTSWGHDAFEWLGDRVSEFLAYTDAGSQFVFGELYEQHYFAFKVLPVVVFFSTFVSMLYYLGVMQAVIKMVGKFLAFCLGTSATESVNAAGNIFIGQTEAPLLIRPFLKDMTNSEIHAVMTGGFATIAGAVMAAYILYKVPANHLLSASAMSAPAALAMAKLFYPETAKSKHSDKDVYKFSKGSERNMIEAASNGASMSVKLVANIAVNLIAFVALLHFINATLTWFGDRVGVDNLTFQFICSYLFWPISFLMGVDQDDCKIVAELIGTKIFLNEFVAYVDLSKFIKNQITFDDYISNYTSLFNTTAENLTDAWYWVGDNIYLNYTGTTLERGLIGNRSVVLATYALCGFSNLSSMGIQLGALGAMAPERKSDMSKIVFRAMLAGNVACFLTACSAGIFL